MDSKVGDIMKVLVIMIFSGMICECMEVGEGVGYRVGNVSEYKLLKTYNRSKLYQAVCSQLDDGRPIKMVQLVGSHYQVGYAYAAMLGPDIVQNYHTFISAEFPNPWQVILIKSFLSWQYDQFVGNQIPHEFKQQLRGLQNGGVRQHKIDNLRKIFHHVLVVSSYPGSFANDIIYSLVDQFMRQHLLFEDERLLNIVQANLFYCVNLIQNFLNKKSIHCSFFALWGNRTEGNRLITMRNLDWEANTGMNKFKAIFIWKITDTIPHVTLGFPGLMGALTGMSKAGLTVHEAGIDSMRVTELGFQWTLRLRYVMMYASNLQQVRKLWQETNNTLGINHMIASANDVVTDHPAYAMETMRNYTAWFRDGDERENGTVFVDPQTKERFEAGFAMKQALYRTNHAYDSKINKYRTDLPTKNSSTMRRYLIMRDGIKYYESINKKITKQDALNITASTAHKGGGNPYRCPGPGDTGTNVISALFLPAEMKMYAGFQYGSGSSYQTGCCGVYVYVDLQRWFD